MALEWSSEGDRLPAGRHVATIGEIEAFFVDAFPTSTRRRPLFESFKVMRVAITRVVPIREQWLNGSFVTDKLEPADIDVVTIVEGSEFDALDGSAQMLLKGLVHAKVTQYMHGCDSYLMAHYPAASSHRSTYDHAEAYWDGWFGVHRVDGRPKGYVQVVPDA
jgi:hypothetical protein